MLQEAVETCLFSASVETKLAAMERLAISLEMGDRGLGFKGVIRSTSDVLFPVQPTWVMPRQLKRRSMSDPEGLKVFLHAVAHIEFVAIHLALDAAYRFRQVPVDFTRDWLGVAVEEAKHFKAVIRRMEELSAQYGDYPAHGGLWELAEETADDLLARMALIPRFMEARGLDVTPGMIEKFERYGDQKTVHVLSLILREEVGHVALGSRWFRWAADAVGLESEDAYFDLVNRYLAGEIRGPFNLEARKEAGFSASELDRLMAVGQTSPA